MAPLQPRKLQIGVVGIGRMGRRHALNILHLTPRADLLCACSPAQPDIEWANEAIIPHGTKVYSTFEEMIETPGLEAVIIASATAMHASQSRIALERGIHVLCEKPVTFSLEELQKIVDQSLAVPDTKFMVGFTRRFDDSYKDARQKIKAGQIGDPVVFRSHGIEDFDDSGFFINYARVSGGIFLDTTIHDIDLSMSFFGDDVQPKKIWATGVVAKYHEMKEFNDADNAVGVVEFWGRRIAHFYHSRTGSSGYDNTTDIFGTEGKITINGNARRNRVEITGAHGVRNETHAGWIDRYEDAFINEVNDFTAAILDKGELPMKVSSAVTSLKIALALQESLVSGSPIHFDQHGNRVSTPTAAL